MKTSVYVDAFNLYFGAVKGTPFKWLDIQSFCRILLPKHSIESVKYFTARVNPRTNDPDQPKRQAAYLRALQTIPMVEIYYGHFLENRKTLLLADPKVGQDPYVEVIKTEEKGSDVNLACQLLVDAFAGGFECTVIISGDSDLLMPVQIVKEQLHKPVGVINPQRIPCRVLEKHATFYKHIRKLALAKCQFPEHMIDAAGPFSKPQGW